jgi:hypothetical protein
METLAIVNRRSLGRHKYCLPFFIPSFHTISEKRGGPSKTLDREILLFIYKISYKILTIVTILLRRENLFFVKFCFIIKKSKGGEKSYDYSSSYCSRRFYRKSELRADL